jgi:hypothetical protein
MWSDKSSFTLFLASGRVYIWRTPKEAHNPECLVPTVNHKGGSVMVSETISWYSVGPIITLHGRITTREFVYKLDNQIHPMTRMLFQKYDAVFQDDNSHIHSAGTVNSWFEEYECEHLPWPAQSPNFNIS